MNAVDINVLQYDLGQLKERYNDVMQEIRECAYDSDRDIKQFKYLANKKQNISKRIDDLNSKINKWLEDLKQ